MLILCGTTKGINWDWFIGEEREVAVNPVYIANQNISKDVFSSVNQLPDLNVLEMIDLNTSEWKCIKKILQCDDAKNFTKLLLMTVSLPTIDKIKECYPSEELSSWQEFKLWWTNTDFYIFLKKNCWYFVGAGIFSIILFICVYILCTVVCKRKTPSDDDLVN